MARENVGPVSHVIQALEALGVDYPKIDAVKREQMEQTRAILEAEAG